MKPFKELTPIGKARRQRDNLQRQLDAVDKALPVWAGTGSGRVQTINDLVGALKTIVAARNNYHAGDLVRAVDAARPILDRIRAAPA